MMRVIRKFCFSGLLFAAVLFAENAGAALVQSTYLGGAWQGTIYRHEGNYQVQVDFAVYDTMGGNEFVNAGYEAPGTGQYIYAYQIFNDLPFSKEEIDKFYIVDKQGASINQALMQGTGSRNDNSGGVAPIDPSPSEGVWEFNNGILIAGKHSWLLVFSSNSAPVAGDFRVETSTANIPIVPEPATMALLGIGGTLTFIRRRKRS